MIQFMGREGMGGITVDSVQLQFEFCLHAAVNFVVSVLIESFDLETDRSEHA